MELGLIGIYSNIIVMLITNRIVGFDDLGNTDNFTTAHLEYRLIKTGNDPRCMRLTVVGVISRPRVEEENNATSILGFTERNKINDSNDDSDYE
jgi:hypothetical protein